MLIGQIGYGLAALAFGLLALLALSSWRGRLQGGLLVAATLFSAAWALAAGLTLADPAHWRVLVALETLRNTLWLVFVARLTQAGRGTAGIARQLACLLPAAFVFTYGLSTAFSVGGVAGASVLVQALVLTGLVTAIAGLVLLEQVYRALRQEAHRAVLPLVIGLGAMFAYDLFLYSHGLLFKGIHSELWSARGFANFLAVPLLLLAARRNPLWSVDVFVSRHVAFYTTSVVAIGVYLVVMAVAGYGLRIAGGQWGTILQVVFLFGAMVMLAWIIFSPHARARLKVFIAKHFYSNKYDYRDEWLRLTRRLAEAEESAPLPQRGLQALVEIAGADGGALWVSDATREADGYRLLATSGVFAMRANAPGPEDNAQGTDASITLPDALSAGEPIIRFLSERRWTVNVAEALDAPESHEGLVIPPWLEKLGRNTLVVPLLNRDLLRGAVVISGPKFVGRLSYEDIDLFRVAGMQIAAALAQSEADQLLSESRQFEAYNRFAAFIMHDLKNVIAQQSLVVRNAARYRDDPAFIDDALDTVANSVERMQRLLDQLKRGQGQAQVERSDLRRLLTETVDRHSHREPRPTVVCPDETIKITIDRERLAAVLGHLLANAQDATAANGNVRMEAALSDEWLVLAVEDDGNGMDDDFVRERLFRPFDTTKGSKGMGIGAYQARKFVEAAGGEVHVRSAPGMGTRFELRFPAALVELETEGEKVRG